MDFSAKVILGLKDIANLEKGSWIFGNWKFQQTQHIEKKVVNKNNGNFKW